MPGSPYTDLTRPPLHQASLRRGLLVPGGLYTDLRVVLETGSTNADVARAAREGAPEGLVIVAESQTAGRGRLDRQWRAPARAAITMSVLLRPRVPPGRLGWLSLLAGVALVEAVGRLAVVETALKWPNDLLIRAPDGGFGKCAGVLAEAVNGGAVVLGLGLNVAQHRDELPDPVDPAGVEPISLALAGAATTDRDPLLRAVLRALATWYGRWTSAGGDPSACGLAAAYRTACHTIGREVRVTVPGQGVVLGEACDIDGDGRLVVATPDGTHALAAGDVQHVR